LAGLFQSVVGIMVVVTEAVAAVAVIVSLVGGLSPYVLSALGLRSRPTISEVRFRISRGLVLSLDIFIAADLLRTIPQPGVQEVIVLGVVTLLRIALSLSLDFELSHLGNGLDRGAE
jgi:uncharacterized membrane protein